MRNPLRDRDVRTSIRLLSGTLPLAGVVYFCARPSVGALEVICYGILGCCAALFITDCFASARLSDERAVYEAKQKAARQAADDMKQAYAKAHAVLAAERSKGNQ